MSTPLDSSPTRAQLYPVFHWVARTALRWYYREVTAVNIDRIPPTGPILVAVNHPNALVDALVAVSVVPRPLCITAKATLFDHRLLGSVLRGLGIVPLRRVADEAGGSGNARSPTDRRAANQASFDTLLDALSAGAAVLIFPEGISHSHPALAPLKSGIARIALSAIERGITPITIVPVGLTFERKESPRSRVLAQVGDPIRIAAGTPIISNGATPLMAEVDERLRRVTLNFASVDAASRARHIAHALAIAERRADAALRDAEPPLVDEIALTRRVQHAAGLLESPDAALRLRAQVFVEQLDAWYAAGARSGAVAEDLWIDLRVPPGIWFVLRETAVVMLVGPLALWGHLNHWIPLRLARWIGRRTAGEADEPAMHTIVAGLALVLLFYGAQTALVGALAGPWWAALYLVTLPGSATWDFHFGDRWRRVIDRARTYLALRRDPARRDALRTEGVRLWEEARRLEQVAETESAGRDAARR